MQMVHNPEAHSPQCRLQLEDSEEYGPVIVPETAVADALRSMTGAFMSVCLPGWLAAQLGRLAKPTHAACMP